MSYKSFASDRVFVLRWTKPEMGDLPRISDTLKGINASTGKKVVYIAITDHDEAPDSETRKAMASSLAEVLAYCASIHTVLTGTGLKFTAIRTGVAGIFVLQGRKNMHMHNSFEDALKKADLNADETRMVTQKAIEQGFIDS